MRIEAHGLSIAPPEGWDARITRRRDSGPVLHVASFTLHPTDGDFGAAATGRMRPDDAFAALVEYRPDHQIRPGHGLFAEAGWQPRLRIGAFSPMQLQVTRSGHLGVQRFFTHAGRPFCLYAVIAPVRKRPDRLAAELSAVLRTLRFTG